MGQRWSNGYSADVEIFLVIEGKRYDVAQVGNGGLLLRDSHQIPPSTNATLVLRIDGVEQVEEVVLTDGAVDNEQLVTYF